MEEVDYDDTYAPVARINSIHMFLTFVVYKAFKVYQMDVIYPFLNDVLEEEVYIRQPPGFKDYLHPEFMYKLYNTLYGLKQTLRVWYEWLCKFLMGNGFKLEVIDTTSIIKYECDDIFLVQIYIDDIIFCSTKESLCIEFLNIMSKEVEMSMMGELKKI